MRLTRRVTLMVYCPWSSFIMSVNILQMLWVGNVDHLFMEWICMGTIVLRSIYMKSTEIECYGLQASYGQLSLLSVVSSLTIISRDD